MKKYIKLLVGAIAAGILIGIGGWVNLCIKETSPVAGALFFGLGLFSIIVFGFPLFTGKVGYIFENKPIFLLDLLVIWIGNFIGAVATGYAMRATRMVKASAEVLCETKINDSIISILILSIFCGMLIYLAVSIQKKEIAPIFKLVAIFFAVVVFILCGHEHVVANMFYFAAGNVFNGKTFLYLLIMTLGNGIGSLILWGLEKSLNWFKK